MACSPKLKLVQKQTSQHRMAWEWWRLWRLLVVRVAGLAGQAPLAKAKRVPTSLHAAVSL